MGLTFIEFNDERLQTLADVLFADEEMWSL